MVASKFPVEQRKKVIFWGIGGAVILRIILTLLTAYLIANYRIKINWRDTITLYRIQTLY